MLVPRSPLSFQTLYKWEEKGSTKRVHLQRWLFMAATHYFTSDPLYILQK